LPNLFGFDVPNCTLVPRASWATDVEVEIVHFDCPGQKITERLTSIPLSGECEIEPGSVVAHFGATVISGTVKIGSNS
jgi:hypothetical protein